MALTLSRLRIASGYRLNAANCFDLAKEMPAISRYRGETRT
jgi:hypothetical protein